MYRPRRISKSVAERRHALQRFGERMGFGLSSETYNSLVEQIQQGKATFVRKQSNRVTVWRLYYEGKPVRVAYDKQRHLIVTFMPEEAERIVDMSHPNEVPFEQLILIRADLYSQEVTEEVAKKIRAIEFQIARHEAELKEKMNAGVATAKQLEAEAERVAKAIAQSDAAVKAAKSRKY